MQLLIHNSKIQLRSTFQPASVTFSGTDNFLPARYRGEQDIL
jgi:hypothetical protein